MPNQKYCKINHLQFLWESLEVPFTEYLGKLVFYFDEIVDVVNVKIKVTVALPG